MDPLPVEIYIFLYSVSNILITILISFKHSLYLPLNSSDYRHMLLPIDYPIFLPY